MKYYWIELDAYKSVEKMKNYVEKVIVGYGSDYEIIFIRYLMPLSNLLSILYDKQPTATLADFDTITNIIIKINQAIINNQIHL